ncbi:DGQHR domain-containing protein [Candidatus Bathyarchaeota archaeon]|nr:DGQHR domain-containing protein [Candidatus Bathyarchaeota archaeon]
MRLKAFAIRQWGGRGNTTEIYVTTMRVGDLLARCSIDRWTPENPRGYQRMPDERRLMAGRGSPVRYLLRELGCFPTSILVNVRGDLRFEAEEDLGWCRVGDLVIGEEETLWLIDGQHRVEALRRAISRNEEFEDYPLIVSVLRLRDIFDEMVHFYIVNKRQKSVPTDLAYRHLQRMLWERGIEWLYELEGARGVRLALATEIVDHLNGREDSPWHRRIRRVGEPARPEHIIRDGPLIRSIGEILKEKTFEGLPLEEVADLLIGYWRAIRDLYPEAFESPGEYSLLGTPGVFSFHRLFPSVYARCIKGGVVDERTMGRVLSLLLEETPNHPKAEFRAPITVEFWSKRHGPAIAISTSLQIIKELYLNLAMKLRLAEIIRGEKKPREGKGDDQGESGSSQSSSSYSSSSSSSQLRQS